MMEDKGESRVRRFFRSRKIWGLLVLILLVGVFVLTYKIDELTHSAPTTADCNPIPITPPTLPDFVESISYQEPGLFGSVQLLHVEENIVYLGIGDSLVIMDASNTAEPQLISSLSLSRVTSGIRSFNIHNELAFVRWGDLWDQSNTVDLTDLTAPIEAICSSDISGRHFSKLFADRYYIFDTRRGSIRVWDTELGKEASRFGFYSDPQIVWERVGRFNIPVPHLIRSSPFNLHDFSFDGRYVYILNTPPSPNCCSRITILDLENPENPEQVGEIPLYTVSFWEVKFLGDFLFVSGYEPGNLYSSTIIYDVHDKQQPIELISIPSKSLPIIHEGYAYFPGGSGIDIWELEAEFGPEMVGRFSIPGIVNDFYRLYDTDMAFLDNYFYFAYGPTLSIFDNQNPSNPILVNQLQYPDLPYIGRIVAAPDKLVAIVKEQKEAPIQILDIDDQGQMGKWESLAASTSEKQFRDITITGDLLYGLYIDLTKVEHGTNLYAFDLFNTTIQNPDSSVFLPRIDAWDMAGDYPYLYLSQFETFATLEIIDVSNFSDPNRVTFINTEGKLSQDVIVWNDKLYYSSVYDPGLNQFDISNKLTPRMVDFYPYDAFDALTIGDGLLFGLIPSSKIAIIDISSNSQPTLIGTYEFVQGRITDIAYADSVLYLARGRQLIAVKLDLEKIRPSD